MIEKHLTAAQLAEILGFSAGTIVDWAERREIPSFKIGGRLRFRESEVEAWIERRRQGPGVEGDVRATPTERPTQGVISQVRAIPTEGDDDAC